MSKKFYLYDYVKSTKQAVKRLPYGSVIVNSNGYPILVREDDLLSITSEAFEPASSRHWLASGPYLIVHIGDVPR